jgi:hypothetical protein
MLLCMFHSCILAQLTLTSVYNPLPGDIGKYFYCDTTGIMPGDSGSNRIWNFNNLQVIDSSTVNYIAPDSTPYISSFPLANIASYSPGQTPVIYSYYKTTASGNEYLGYAYTDFLYILSNTQIVMQYPFTYNNTFNDNFSGTGILSGISFIVRGTDSTSGDASGMITLPFGTYSNALRTKTIQTEVDSAITYPYVISISSVEYSWYVSTLKFPVFSIYYYTTVNNGDTTIGKDVYYCNSQLIGLKKNRESVPVSFKLYQNYPNPFNPKTKIKFSLPRPSEGGVQSVRLTVYDLLGKEVETLVPPLRGGQEGLQPGTYEVEWDGTNYPSGAYFYKLIAGDYSDTKKMMLIK